MSFFKDINSDFYNESSILKGSNLVSWKRERGVYNFKELPIRAIISIKKNVFSKVVSPFSKRIKGINGAHYIYKSKVLLCSEFGSGASALLALLEELRALGVEQFVFIGSAGILFDSAQENNAYIVSKVFSSSGSSFFYFRDEEIDCYDKEWFEKIKDTYNLKPKVAWSTDCPFRETPSLLNYYRSKDCALVDMESAAVYSFSQYFKTPAVCILVGADKLTASQWKSPGDVDKLLKVKQKLIFQLLKF